MLILRLKRSLPVIVIALTFGIAAGADDAEDADEIIRNAFSPYIDGPPSMPGYKPGVAIDASNFSTFADAIPEGLSRVVADGGYVLETRPTFSIDISENYKRATREQLGKVQLGPEVGDVTGFVAGRPFPEDPSPDDPRAGEKLIWNYQYGYAAGDALSVDPMYWTYKHLSDGTIDRRIELEGHLLNVMGRVDTDPKPELTPNPHQILRSLYLNVREPFELRDTQLLMHRYIDDKKRDDAWMYLGSTRRIRRLATGQTTDSYLGSELMIEDFGGYNGRISDYKWSYVRTANVVMPFYRHSELTEFATDPPPQKDGYQFVEFGGQGGCFPLIHWQLRKVFVLDGSPVDESHPVTRRRLYIDAQTFTVPYEDIYDVAGKLWKIYIVGQAHPDFYKGSEHAGIGASFFEVFTVVDLQAGRCTVGQFYLHPNSKKVKRRLFDPGYMQSKGR